jgi:glutamate dehydrogenase/leucine dehydrogenase
MTSEAGARGAGSALGWGIGDEIGPARIAVLHDARAGLEAVVVVDNVACGPAIGGVRMAADVTVEEVSRLARAMTWKNAGAGLAHGGGKAGILADPAGPPARKEALVRTFARMIRDLRDYIPGPDMGTDETCMAWVKDEIGRAVGLPRVVGGIPLDEIGATGFGLAVAAESAAADGVLSLDGARVAVEGFGAVGQHAARFLARRGARLVAASDSAGAIADPRGLDVEALIAHKRSGRPVAAFAAGRRMSGADLVAVESEIWIPAARPDTLTADNAGRLRTRLVLQGANIPATEAAEAEMHARGILSLPDFVVNAGGVICAAVEYHGGTQAQALAAIEEKIRANTREVLERARAGGLLPRQAALQMVRGRVEEAMRYRRP